MKPRIGLHVSAAGGFGQAVERAQALGCECFQFFSRSPQGGKAPPISRTQATRFRALSQRSGLESYIHAPYFINFASSNNRISFGSVSAVREELERGSVLGVTYVMTHLGSASDLGAHAALKQVVERIQAIFDQKKGGPYLTALLLEISAGAGGVIGDTFEQLAFIVKGVGRPDLGICLDTCHLFASGYDLRTTAAITGTMREFKKHLPLGRFQLVHANDSQFDLGSHKDRHAHIGEGHLGEGAFRALLHHRDFQGRNFVLEPPGDDADRDAADVVLLKRLRANPGEHGRGGDT